MLRDDSKLALRQWEMSLQSNAASHWLGSNLESALIMIQKIIPFKSYCISKRTFSIMPDFLTATKQPYEWFSPSVRLSVCLSVRPTVTPFSLCSHHCIIMKFSRVITNDKSDVHAKSQGQRSKVKVTEVKTQFNRYHHEILKSYY